MVDASGFEPITSPCKGDVIPDFTTGPMKILGTFNLTAVFDHFTKSSLMARIARLELANGGLTQSFSAVSALIVDMAGIEPASLL